jgi:hypothetical protein
MLYSFGAPQGAGIRLLSFTFFINDINVKSNSPLNIYFRESSLKNRKNFTIVKKHAQL